MEIETVEVTEILPTKIWAEKDTFGTVHIKMQHQGMDEFDFIQMQYNYAYTSNGHQYELTQQILKLLGAPDERKMAARNMRKVLKGCIEELRSEIRGDDLKLEYYQKL